MGKKSTFKKFRKLASLMPVKLVDTKIRKSGEEILAVNKEAKDAKGEPINQKSNYLMPAKVRANHYTELKKAYTKGGLNGAMGYVSQYSPTKNEIVDSKD